MSNNPLLREIRVSPIARTSVIVGLIYVFIAILGPYLAPYDPTAMTTLPRQAPSVEHWFGTDEIGRDIFSRLLVGTRTALIVGFIAVGIGLSIGGVIGIVAAYFGGWLEMLLMRFVDILLAFPGLLLALAVITFLGPGLTNTMIAIGIGGIPGYARLIRGEVLSLLELDYVSAARGLGARDGRIIVRHLLPMAISPMLVYSTAQLARAVLAEAGLSYLGLGVQPPDPSWGGMIASGQRYIFDAPYMAIFPGLAIIVLVFALNLLGDSLRDALNPLLRAGRGQ
ncbi:MAG: ABC transporter permease [Trueperaceae bacterium]|nr:ABC transporter permease [Trueperaceae bacterium]MDZ7799966.1 ABC transporter permease [Trueperaceae bacterium]